MKKSDVLVVNSINQCPVCGGNEWSPLVESPSGDGTLLMVSTSQYAHQNWWETQLVVDGGGSLLPSNEPAMDLCCGCGAVFTG